LDGIDASGVKPLDELERLQSDHRQRRQRMRAESFERELHQAPVEPGTRPPGEHWSNQ
jgi:hypothetical protein